MIAGGRRNGRSRRSSPARRGSGSRLNPCRARCHGVAFGRVQGRSTGHTGRQEQRSSWAPQAIASRSVPSDSAKPRCSAPLCRQQYPGGQSAYYFAASGNDSNPCTQAQPCQTPNKAGTIAYSPGNTINFNGGDNFTGCWSLTPTNVPSRGDKNSPIVVQFYGTGRATLMSNCTGNNVPLFEAS